MKINKNMARASISLIFLSWFFVNPSLGRETYSIRTIQYLVIPLIWSYVFIYLNQKNYLYIAINSYAIFLLMLFADKLNFGNIYGEHQASYLSLSILTSFVFIFIYQELLPKRPHIASMLSFLSTIILCTMPMLYIIYSINFDTIITKDVFCAIMQTNTSESLEFIGDYISPLWIGIVFMLASIVGFLLIKQEKKETYPIEKSLLLFLMLSFATISFVTKEDNRLFSFAKNTLKEYAEEVASFRETQEKVKSSKIQFKAEKTNFSEIYIVVIGESLNKNHMGIYGYMRDTTPLLSKLVKNEKLLVFDNTFASYPSTMKALSLSLTEANQINARSYYNSLSIINILNKAAIDTYWITNQDLYSIGDNLVSVIASQSNHLISLNHSFGKSHSTQVYDGAAIDKIRPILSRESKKNRVIFVHLRGSHSNYSKRYPEKYRKFYKELKPSEFGKLSAENNISARINCYDNSVLYNDYVVSSLIKLLENKNDISGFIYFSDHSEEVGKGLGHDPGNFTYNMIQIPLIMWFSEEYKNRYRDKYSMIESHKNALYCNDNIYDTLIGIFNIDTERYQSSNDLSSPQYLLEESKAYTLYGKIHYTDKSNYFYHQKKNIRILQEKQQALRIIPDKVDSIGKLKDVWSKGYRAFEIDVRFGEKESDFAVLDENDVMVGMTFEQFITSVGFSEIEKICLNIKNLTQENYQKSFERLNYLNKRFAIKDNLIVESGTTDNCFSKFKETGWHISYCLPKDTILNLLNENKTNKMRDLAKSISEQSVLQKLSSFSFDYRLYPFVKQYLEPLISNNIVYHTRDLSVKLLDTNLYSKLSKKSYFIDNRFKTIFLYYRSLFDGVSEK